MEESIGFCSVCGNASKLLRMIFHNNKWYCRECFYKVVEKRECKTCKNPYCSRPIEERQKQEVQHHFQYGWECTDKEKYLQDDGGFVLVKKEEIAELKNQNNILSKALDLYVNWADECGIAWDNFPDMKEKWYKIVEEKGLGWIDGLVFMVMQEAKEQLEKEHK